MLLKRKIIGKNDFDFFVENQKRDLRVFIDSQPAQAQERAEEETLHLLDIGTTKVVPELIGSARCPGDPSRLFLLARPAKIRSPINQRKPLQHQSRQSRQSQVERKLTRSPIPSPTASDAQVRIDAESAGAVYPAAQATLSRALAAQGFAPPNWAVAKGPRDRVTVQNVFSGRIPVRGEDPKALPFASSGIYLLWQLFSGATRQKITGPGTVDIWLPDPAIKPLLVNKTSQSKKVTPTPLPLPRK